jgi:hypothetical protein
LFPDAIGNFEFALDEAIFEKYPGCLNLSRIYDIIKTSEDVWLVYQCGGDTLGNQLFTIDVIEQENEEGEEDEEENEVTIKLTHSFFYKAIIADV